MLHISLFSGIGGFDLASEWMGWTNIVSCEINPFGQRVLEHYWPDAYHHDDIHTLTYEVIDEQLTKRFGADWRADDIILTGGFPCQPYSAAGKRQGKEDDRHLWPQMLRVIREVRPKWIVGENVLGLVNWNGGMVFDEVQADLEAEGYEVQPYVLSAACIGAPHRRDRIWFVAYTINGGYRPGREKATQANGISGIGGSAMVAGQLNRASVSRHDTDTDSPRLQTQRTEQQTTGASRGGTQRYTPDTTSTGLERMRGQEGGHTKLHTGHDGHGRWEAFPTQSPVRRRNDGFPGELDSNAIPNTKLTKSKWRNESIKAYGNAIVPQVAHQIFKAIQQYEDQH